MENKKKKPNNTHILLAISNDSKSNPLHVDIFQFCITYLSCVL